VGGLSTDLHRLVVRCEALIDRSGVAPRIDARMPTGGRPRQLPVRTLLIGLLVNTRRGNPQMLTRVWQTLLDLDATDRSRLGIDLERDGTMHQVTYRQVEYLFTVVVRLMDATPVPSFRGVARGERAAHLAEHQPGADEAAEREEVLNSVCDQLLESTIPDGMTHLTSLAVDWTDADSWARKPPNDGRVPADPNARWARRRSQQPGTKDEFYFGYSETIAVIVQDEHGPQTPNLVRRMDLESAKEDPAWKAVEIIGRMRGDGHLPGDLLGDAAYSSRKNLTRAVMDLGYAPLFDLNPNDSGPKGTFEGARISNGSLFCPATPEVLLDIRKPTNSATKEAVAAHDEVVARREAYRLNLHSERSASGSVRLICPAAAGKVRCPVRQTMNLGFDRPEILAPPAPAPKCCTQKTITLPPEVADKQRQKHPYGSKEWRSSYNRRTGVERGFGSAKDKSREDVSRGRIRVMGRTKQRLLRTFVYMSVNERLLERFEARTTGSRAA
jgi:hypothetical protein